MIRYTCISFKGGFLLDNMAKVLPNYEVNSECMALVPRRSNNSLYTHVYETSEDFIVLKSPTEIIKRSCGFFGASYRGRMDGTQFLTGISHKAPIAVSPENKLFFFPTHSPRREECSWFSHSHIVSLERSPLQQTTVHFSNQTSHRVDVSYGSFENQLHRTAQLKSAYAERYEKSAPSKHFTLVKENEISKYVDEYFSSGTRRRSL